MEVLARDTRAKRRPSLARLWQAHGIEVLLAVDPALQAVDADLYPYVSVYAERDRFGILIPGDWGPGFELFDLALGLHDYVFGREALIGFGKETHKRGLIIAVRFDREWIRAAFDLSLRGRLNAAPGRLQLAADPIDQHRINDVEVSRPHSELQDIMHYGGRCSSKRSWSGAKRISADIEKLSINKYWRAKRAEEAFIRGIFVAAVLEPEYLHPASAVRSRGQLHSVNQYAAALLGGERVRADSNAAREHAILESHQV